MIARAGLAAPSPLRVAAPSATAKRSDRYPALAVEPKDGQRADRLAGRLEASGRIPARAKHADWHRLVDAAADFRLRHLAWDARLHYRRVRLCQPRQWKRAFHP